MCEFTAGYFDDILIFSRNKSDHVIHVKTVLDKLLQEQLKLNKNKCVFYSDQVEYLGFKIKKWCSDNI